MKEYDTLKEEQPSRTTDPHNSNDHDATPTKQQQWWKKLLKWLGVSIASIFLLLTLLTLALYIPTVQNWIVGIARVELAKSAGINISYSTIRVGFPLKLRLEKVSAVDTKTNRQMVEVELLTANVSIWPLLKGKNLPVRGILLERAKTNLALSNDSIQIRGSIGKLSLDNIDMDLSTLSIDANSLLVHDANVYISILSDTIDKPEKENESEMVIKFASANIKNVAAEIWLYPDTMEISSHIAKAKINRGEVNIKEGYYQAADVSITAGVTTLGDSISILPMPWYAEVRGKSVRYDGPDDVRANIERVHYQVGDKVLMEEGSLKVRKDRSRLEVTDIDLTIGDTHISGSANFPFSQWLPDSIGPADLHLKGLLNPAYLKHYLGESLPLPEEPLDFNMDAGGEIRGDLKYALSLYKDGLIDLDLKGIANNATSPLREIRATFGITSGKELKETIMGFAKKGKSRDGATWTIPAGLHLKGSAHYSPALISTDFRLSSESHTGDLVANASYRPKSKNYMADIRVSNFALQPFLPSDTIGPLTATINLEGHGTDPFSPYSNAILMLDVDSVSYRQHSLTDIMLLSQLKENQLFAALNSDNDGLKMVAQTDVLLKRDSISGSINILVDTIIPAAVGLDIPILQSGKMELRSSIFSDLEQIYNFHGEVENFILVTDKGVIHPKNTYISAETSDRKINAKVSSGDLILQFKANNGLNDFSERIKRVVEEAQKSLADSVGQLNMAPWIRHYPEMELSFEMGRDNLLRTYLDEHRIGATSVSLDLKTSASEGLSGLGVVSYFQTDTFKIDNIDLVLRQDSSFFTAMGTVHKEHFRNQPAFDVILSLSSNVKRSEAYISWLDSRQREFLQMGIELFNRPNGDLTFGFTPDPVVLAYNRFEVIDDDYVTLPHGDRTKIRANLKLATSEGTSIKINDLPDSRGHLLTASINNLKLSELEGIPLVPNLSGLLNTTIDWLQLPDKNSEMKADLRVDRFYFNKKPFGNLHALATANTSTSGTALRGSVDIDSNPTIALNAYAPKGDEKARYHITVTNLYLEKINPLLPSKYARVKGAFNAEVYNYNLTQEISKAPTGLLNGQLLFDEASLYTPFANETYTLDNQPIKVVDNKVLFDQFALIANKGKLLTNGYVSLANSLLTDLHIEGRDVLLLNSSETNEAMIFGRVNTDADLHIRGPLAAFSLQGNLSIKGDTDVTYQSQTGELQNRAGYKNLVNFTDFSDTLFVKQKVSVDSLSLGGRSIRLAIHIDPATKVNAILTNDGNNKGSLQGGGDFNISVPAYGTMTLNGTYNIHEGDIHLYISPISRKFKVRQGSKVTWSGLLMEPDIDVTATARVKSNVSLPGETTRQVDFDVNVIAENRLDNLKLRFETQAPQDLSIRNTLARLSPDEQNRQSIMLLATGHFFGSGGSSNSKGFDVNGALSSLLASQINSIAGEALDAEINVGISDGTNAYGVGTNYSYSFTKRLFNNRISVQVGGKMVTGAAAAGLQQTFIDNMSLDYQLDQAGTHYLRLFHNKNYENLLDGEVIETGIGYIIRRKMDSLKDLFKFSNPLPPNEPNPRAIWELKAVPPKENATVESNDEDTK